MKFKARWTWKSPDGKMGRINFDSESEVKVYLVSSYGPGWGCGLKGYSIVPSPDCPAHKGDPDAGPA